MGEHDGDTPANNDTRKVDSARDEGLDGADVNKHRGKKLHEENILEVRDYARKKVKQRRIKLKDFSDLEPWKRYMTLKWAAVIIVIGVLYLAAASAYMIHAAYVDEQGYFNQNSEKTQASLATAAELGAKGNATHVLTGTYVENIPSVDLKTSKTTVTLLVWFRWEGSPKLDMVSHFNVYRGKPLTYRSMLADETVGSTRYKLIRVTYEITRPFDTTCFPLSSQQLPIYIESQYKADKVLRDKRTRSCRQHHPARRCVISLTGGMLNA